ncbi:MAG: methyltransferase domain-containing protein [Vicinamibacterales bacterium]
MLTRGLIAALFLSATLAFAQEPAPKFEPKSGLPGKDVVWVPTPPELVEKMLDMAGVTPADYVIDLGSGDGRNVIAAARRGARALGVEFNPDLVALSRRLAAEAGVADNATFVQGDMYEADISQATVLALYLLPVNLTKLAPKFLDLKPGTRIVANTFGPEDWDPDRRQTVEGLSCSGWCEALLWIVPAKVAGTWQLPQGTLTLTQSFQLVLGTFGSGGASTPLARARMNGDEISFIANGLSYVANVSGDTMTGTVTSGSGTTAWVARRTP